jgi:uncharacterized protein (TIGR02284 family)
MNVQHDIGILNRLTITTLNSMKMFEEAAVHAKSARTAAMFTDLARDRGEIAASFQTRIRRLGGEPEERTGTLGSAYRGAIDLKPEFTGQSDKATFQMVESGDANFNATFEAALRVRGLEWATLGVIREAFSAVQASALRHGVIGEGD